ncbi:MAG TPA: amino acid ABC transporter permease [Desulfobacteria bacterium]|nr:amino acid ABC transporter permease [Desulfobacteria bacterium]
MMIILSSIRYDILMDYYPLLLKGTITTIKFSLISVIIGTILGLLLCFMYLSDFRLLKLIYTLYINVFRGTPSLVQILIFHFAILPSIGVFPAAVSGIVALSFNCGAYISEIFRAGIMSIDRGQMEAARSLGMTYAQAMRYVILPQAFQRVIPPLGNVFISMLKNSSLVSIISIQDLTYTGSLISESTLRVWEAWLAVAFLYLIMTWFLSWGLRHLESRLAKSEIRDNDI